MRMWKHMRTSFPMVGLSCSFGQFWIRPWLMFLRGGPGQRPQCRAIAVWNQSVSQWLFRAGGICGNPSWVFPNEQLSCLNFFSINTIADVISMPWKVHGLNSGYIGNQYLECHLALLCRNFRVSSTLEFEMLSDQPQHLPLNANLYNMPHL